MSSPYPIIQENAHGQLIKTNIYKIFTVERMFFWVIQGMSRQILWTFVEGESPFLVVPRIICTTWNTAVIRCKTKFLRRSFRFLHFSLCFQLRFELTCAIAVNKEYIVIFSYSSKYELFVYKLKILKFIITTDSGCNRKSSNFHPSCARRPGSSVMP